MYFAIFGFVDIIIEYSLFVPFWISMKTLVDPEALGKRLGLSPRRVPVAWFFRRSWNDQQQTSSLLGALELAGNTCPLVIKFYLYSNWLSRAVVHRHRKVEGPGPAPGPSNELRAVPQFLNEKTAGFHNETPQISYPEARMTTRSPRQVGKRQEPTGAARRYCSATCKAAGFRPATFRSKY